jgi:hypothetical protein
MGLPKDQGYNELPAIDWSDNAVRVTLSLKAGQSVPDGKRFVNEAGVFLKPIFDPPVYRVSGVILEETTNVKRIGVPSATEFGIR